MERSLAASAFHSSSPSGCAAASEVVSLRADDLSHLARRSEPSSASLSRLFSSEEVDEGYMGGSSGVGSMMSGSSCSSLWWGLDPAELLRVRDDDGAKTMVASIPPCMEREL